MSIALSAAILSMLSVALIVMGAHTLLSPEIDIASRLGASLVGPKRKRSAEQHSSPIGAKMDEAMAGSSFAFNIQRELARADLKLTVSEYLVLNATSILGLAAIGLLMTHSTVPAIAGAVIGFYLPRFYVSRRQGARKKAFSNQLGDIIILIANSLRSGYSLLQSLDLVAREAPPPASEEFNRVVREVNLGLTPEEALAHLVDRIDSEDLDLMVTAINVQHEVGGNLALILDTIAETIRERVRIKGEIKSLTAQQTLSGYVISLLPIGLGFILYLINPTYMAHLFSFEFVICMPVIGMPICAGVMILFGFIIMRNITNIDV